MTVMLERIINLLCYFYSCSRPVTLEEIGKEVNGYKGLSEAALRQQFYRDRRQLEEIGVYIDFDSNSNEYSLSRVSFPKLAAVDFTPEEKRVLVELLNMMLSLKELPNYENLKYAVYTMAATLKILSKVLQEEPLVSFSFMVSEEEEELFEKLREAASTSKVVEFEYRPMNRSKYSLYKVKPVKLALRDGEWYLIGLNQSDEARLYKLKRMRNLKLLNEEFQIDKERAEAVERLRCRPWEYEEEAVKVLIEAEKNVAPLLMRRFDALKVQEKEDTVLLEINLNSEARFLQEFSKFIYAAKALEPPEIRDNLKKMIKEAIKGLSYGSQKS